MSGPTVRGQGLDRLVLSAPVQVELTRFDDSYVGTAAADRVLTGGGQDTVRTKGGDDWVFFERDTTRSRRDLAWLGRGDDTVFAWYDRASIDAGPGADEVTGGPLGPVVDAGSGADKVSIDVADGYPTGVVTGGPGRDSLACFGFISRWDMYDGHVVLGPKGTLEMSFLSFERARLDGAAATPRLVVTGTGGPDTLSSPVTATTFAGRGGADRFSGSRFVDTFDGGGGDDRYLTDPNPAGGNRCVSVEADDVGACSP